MDEPSEGREREYYDCSCGRVTRTRKSRNEARLEALTAREAHRLACVLEESIAREERHLADLRAFHLTARERYAAAVAESWAEALRKGKGEG